MKNWILGLVIIVALLGGYIVGAHKPVHCHTIARYDDSSFTCDGRVIAGHPHRPNVYTDVWYWLN